MRILAFPAFRRRGYTWFLHSEMRRQGITVDEFSPARLARGGYDIVHLHWPEMAYLHPNPLRAVGGSAAMLALLQRARLRGARVVWTVHNLRAHERHRPRLEALFWKAFVPLLDGYIALTRGGQSMACELYPALKLRPSFVIPLGHYRGAYPDEVTRAQAREALDVPADSPLVTFFGRIRRYKNVPHLIRVFRAMPEPHYTLLVAGLPQSAGLEAEVLESADADPRVRLWLGRIPDDRVQLFLRAADLVALPFTDILNSASALLALSFDRPVLVPQRGAMNELQAAVGEDWVSTYSGELNTDRLRDALAWARNVERAGSPALDGFGWPDVARQTVDAYRRLCSSRILASEPSVAGMRDQGSGAVS